MTIHHATAKKALDNGITLTDEDDTITVQFEARDDSFEYLCDLSAKDALAAALIVKTLLATYPGLELDDSILSVATVDDAEINLTDADAEAINAFISDLDDEARAILENGPADELEDEGDMDDDGEGSRGGVVPAKYRQRYAAEGHPDDCGDWLAVTLKPLTTDSEGKFNPEAMLAICDANGVDAHKYTVNQSRGWQGRMRMASRNVLAKVVAIKGVLIVPDDFSKDGTDKTIIPPAEWCARFAKPKEAKKAKAAAQ